MWQIKRMQNVAHRQDRHGASVKDIYCTSRTATASVHLQHLDKTLGHGKKNAMLITSVSWMELRWAGKHGWLSSPTPCALFTQVQLMNCLAR